LRWATGFAAFWRKSTAEIGMPFTPLAQSICDHAVATQDSKTLLWLTEELRAPLLEPLDESEPEPCKAQMLQVIGKGLAKWPTNAAAPVWHSLLSRIDEMTGDPFDATYSIKLIAAITPQIEDATLRGEVTQRLKQASRELLASDDDNLQAVLGMISKAENTPFTAIEPKTFPPTPIPTAPGGLNSTQAIRAKLAEAQSLPAHGKARAEAMQSAVVGAIYLGDLPFLGQLVHNIVQDALRQDDAYLVLDSFNWMMPKAGPAAAAEVRAILMKALKVAPEGAHSILLRSVASMMPEQPRAAVECARSLLPIISPGPSRRPTDGQMAMWCYLAKNGYLKEIFPLAQSILESTESA
jgi:hypothetical protein